MTSFNEPSERDFVLFVGSYMRSQREALHKLSEQLGKTVSALVLLDEAAKKEAAIAKDPFATILHATSRSKLSVAKAIKPYEGKILAVTARSESNIPLLKKVVPHVPYTLTPTSESLDWSTQKILMRQLLKSYDKSISPKFLVVHDASEESMAKIEKQIGYPLILKPSGLAASLLVTVCYHRDELEAALKKTVRKINALHKKKKGRGEPQMLIEALMEGPMYSIDTYVNARGRMYHAPLVHVTTGRAVGYDDFFGYKQITPVKLRPHKVVDAQKAATSAIRALGLRNTTCHTELMKTEDGWKIIELGPRIGGYRNELYKLSRGMDHSLNDILIRIPKKPVIPKKIKGHAVAMKVYARKEGSMVKIEGINKVRKLKSLKRLTIKKKKGDRLLFARHGGDPVLEVVMFNEDRSELLADIRRLETGAKIVVEKRTSAKAK